MYLLKSSCYQVQGCVALVKSLVFNCNLHNSAAISKPKSLLLENVTQKMRVTHFNKNGERNIVHYILSH